MQYSTNVELYFRPVWKIGAKALGVRVATSDSSRILRAFGSHVGPLAFFGFKRVQDRSSVDATRNPGA
jgi:hypothetical protein